jgi:N-acyl homoserine lactone hydrolase
MNKWTIWPIWVGTIRGIDKSNLTYGVNQGEKIDICCLMFLLKGGAELILVDTGMSDPEWGSKYHRTCSQEESQYPIRALGRLGVSPDEIDIIICTHLHWDHCYNNALFSRARIIVQRDEIQYALFPLPIHAVFYEAFSARMTPPWLKDIGRMEIIHGDQDIVPGVSVIRLPSHTPGFQGVRVKTKKGDYLIGGDFYPLYENWTDRGKDPIPSGIHLNLFDYYDSFKKVNAFTNVLLPGHDMKVLDHDVYPAGS